MSRQFAAGCELVHRIGKEYQKPAWNLPATEIQGKRVAVIEAVVLDKPFCRLVHFQRDVRRTAAAPIHACCWWPRLSAIMPRLLRDTVRALLPAHDVYVTDGRCAHGAAGRRPVPSGRLRPLHPGIPAPPGPGHPRHLGLPAHRAGSAAISLMASANDPCQPRSMVMMGGPIDPRESPTQVNRLATTKPYALVRAN